MTLRVVAAMVVVIGVASCSSATAPETPGPTPGDEAQRSTGASSDVAVPDDVVRASTAAGDTGDVDIGDLSPARIDQIMEVYVECMRPQVDGWVRFSMDPHLGMPLTVSLEGPRPDDDLEAAQQAEAIAADCARESGIEQVSIELQRAQPPTAEQLQSVADDVAVCWDDLGVGESLRAQAFGSADELRRAVDDVRLEADSQGLSQEAFVAKQDCVDTAMFGEKTEF